MPSENKINATSICTDQAPSVVETVPPSFQVPAKALPRPPASPRTGTPQQDFFTTIPPPISPPSPRQLPLPHSNSPPQHSPLASSPHASPRNRSALAASAPSLLTNTYTQTPAPSLQHKALPKPPLSPRGGTPNASPIVDRSPNVGVTTVPVSQPKSANHWGTVRPASESSQIPQSIPIPLALHPVPKLQTAVTLAGATTVLPLPPITSPSSAAGFGSHRSPRSAGTGTPTASGSTPASPLPSPRAVSPPQQSNFSSKPPGLVKQYHYNAATQCASDDPELLRRSRRSEVISEIVRSESDFSRDMSTVQRLFMVPVSRRPDLLAPELVRSLFSNVDALIPLSQQILQATEDEAAKIEEERDQFGGVFLQYADFLRVFKLYCSNLPSAVGMYRRMQSSQWTKFLNERKNDPNTRGVDLETFLVMPFHHVCRYPVLLRALYELTLPSHPDYCQLEQAIQKLDLLVQQVMAYSKDVQDSNAVVRLRYYFTFYSDPHFVLVTPTRRLVRTGPVRVYHQTSNYLPKVPKPGKRELWLFNDLIIVAKPSKKKIKEKGLFPLDTLILWDMVDEKEKVTHAFNLIRNDVPEKIWVACASANEKAAWMKEITEVLAAHTKLVRNRPASITSDSRC